jgi:hypothetical protein
MAGTSTDHSPGSSKLCYASVECLGGGVAAAGATDLMVWMGDGAGEERESSRIQRDDVSHSSTRASPASRRHELLIHQPNQWGPCCFKVFFHRKWGTCGTGWLSNARIPIAFECQGAKHWLFGGFWGLHPLFPATTIKMIRNNQSVGWTRKVIESVEEISKVRCRYSHEFILC